MSKKTIVQVTWLDAGHQDEDMEEKDILGWGEKVEVMEPEELCERVAETARAMLAVYKRR